ncbi:hypothetical protein ACLOJK_003467 [Asimina triloba]
MESEPDPEPSSTPKLSFYSLPPKPPSEPAGMLTPPFRPPASVPFLWEEAPGRPRNLDSKPPSARGLDLPPRLLTEMIITSLPSPTTVLDGPYVGRSVSCSSFREVNLHRSFRGSGKIRSFSPEKVGKEKERGGRKKKAGKEKAEPEVVVDGCDGHGSLVLSPSSLSDREEHASKVKITRFKRKGSSLQISSEASSRCSRGAQENCGNNGALDTLLCTVIKQSRDAYVTGWILSHVRARQEKKICVVKFRLCMHWHWRSSFVDNSQLGTHNGRVAQICDTCGNERVECG